MRLTSLMAGCMIVAVTAFGAPKSAAPAPAAQTPFEILKDLRNDAFDARDAAMELQTLLRSDVDTKTHATKLGVLKDGINTMGKEIYQLQKMRESATPLEQQAIDHAAPLLRLMADNTQAALLYLRDNPTGLWLRSYQKYVNNLAAESDQLTNSVGQYVHLSELQAKEKHIEKSLGAEAGM